MSLNDFYYKLPWKTPPEQQLVTGLDALLGDGDAIALLPYDDGTFFPKRAYFDKGLIGGMGGYETDDGDKIVVDGSGEAVRDLYGVPMLLGVDPTEHAAAVDPIKALIAHKNDIGEWIRVDQKGNVVQVGPALDPAPLIEESEDADEAFRTASDDELLTIYLDEYDPREYSEREKRELVADNEEGIRATLEEALAADGQVEVDANGMVDDGGMVGEAMTDGSGQLVKSFDDALMELAEKGDVTKVYDIAPPSGMYLDDEGDVKIEEATHIAVDQSKAADLMPTTHSTVEINTALDKARMEEYEEGKLMTYALYGAIAGAVVTLVVAVVFFLLFQLGGA